MRAAGRPTVSVAHKDEETDFLLGFWLEYEGHGVEEAAGGLEAERQTRQQGEECVFSILFLPSYTTAEAHAAAANAGRDSFIPRPFIFDFLGELLGRPCAERPADEGRRPAQTLWRRLE